MYTPAKRRFRRRPQQAFTLIELLVVVAVIALLLAILLPALAGARKAARLAICQSNFKQLGISANTYGNDYKERIYSFSWKAGDALSSTNGLNYAANDVSAACNQMVDIIRRRSGRPASEIPRVERGLFPYVTFSHVVLQDYLSKRLPDPVVICPEDAEQKRWSLDPRGYDAGKYQPNYNIGLNDWRWPYRSNYQMTASAVDKNLPDYRLWPVDYQVIGVSVFLNRVHFGNRTLSEVAFPSSKVFMFEQYGRHAQKQFDYRTYYGFDTAKCVMLFFDGSVSLRASKDSNKGNAAPWDFNSTKSTVLYTAKSLTPDPPAPSTNLQCDVRFMFTRSGLKGVDFGGGEVFTNSY